MCIIRIVDKFILKKIVDCETLHLLETIEKKRRSLKNVCNYWKNLLWLFELRRQPSIFQCLYERCLHTHYWSPSLLTHTLSALSLSFFVAIYHIRNSPLSFCAHTCVFESIWKSPPASCLIVNLFNFDLPETNDKLFSFQGSHLH